MRPALPRWTRSRRDGLALAALVLLSLALYARTTGFDFVDFDDRGVLLAQPQLYDETSLAASAREIFVESLPREEPLVVRDLSWALDARLHGFRNPFGYHLGNVVANALVVGLLFVFLRRTTRSFGVAAGASAAFALLPIHVEPVAWIMGRKDLLVSLFMLAGLLAQSVELGSRTRAGRVGAYVAALACTALALGSKVSAVSFFLVLGLHRAFHPWLEGGRAPDAPMRLREALRRSVPATLPHLALCLAFLAWYQGVLRTYGVVGGAGPGALDPVHLGHVLRFQPLLMGAYLTSLVWPHDLSIYHRWPHVAVPLGPGDLLASAAWAAALLGLLGVLLRRRRDLAFHLLMAGSLMLPYAGLLYVGFWRADRYVYLASAGVLVVAAALLRDLARRVPAARPAVLALAGVFLLSSGAQAWRHQEVFRDDEALWSYEAGRARPSLRAIQALAKLHVRRAEAASEPAARAEHVAEARDLIARGLEEVAPAFAVPTPYRIPERLDVARLHVLRGRIARPEGAPPRRELVHYRRAWETAPEARSALLASRALYEAAERAPEAERRRLVEASYGWFTRFLEVSPDDPRRREAARAMLAANYAGRFPYLAERIERTRETHLR